MVYTSVMQLLIALSCVLDSSQSKVCLSLQMTSQQESYHGVHNLILSPHYLNFESHV